MCLCRLRVDQLRIDMPEKIPLTPNERKRYEICKKQISDGLQTVFDTGTAIMEIRDSKLYREEFDTFKDFCKQTYKIGEAHAYRMIEAADVKDSLKNSPIGEEIKNEAQARELANVPEKLREKLIKQIVKSGVPVTAEAIKEANACLTTEKKGSLKMSPIGDKIKNDSPIKDAVELDRERWPIPAKSLEIWSRKQEIQELLTGLSRIKCRVEKADGDLLFHVRSYQRCLETLNAAYFLLTNFMPYAVCPGCNGQVPKSCTWCLGRGFISEQEWNAPDDNLKKIKKIRAAQIK